MPRDASHGTATGTWSPPAPCSGIPRRRPPCGRAALRDASRRFPGCLPALLAREDVRVHRRGSGRDVSAPGEGKVRALGVSIHDRPRAGALAEESILDLLMIRYNAAHPGPRWRSSRACPAAVPPWSPTPRRRGGNCFALPAAGEEWSRRRATATASASRARTWTWCSPAPGPWPSFGRTWRPSIGAALPRRNGGDARVRARGPR